MNKSTAILLAFFAFFFGAFVGLAMAPIKGMFGSNNGNTTNNFYNTNNDCDDEGFSSDDTDDLSALDGIE